MTQLLGLVRRIGLDDIALVGGAVLLWIGLGMVAAFLPYVVIGALALLYGATPVLLTLTRRRR